jgi:c-di-GMP-binding flagellar brake protein YcgR
MTENEEKRKFKRGPLLLPVIMTLEGVSREGFLTDLSAGGCRLYCYSPEPVRSGERIDMFLNLKNSQDIMTLNAYIVWVNPFIYIPDFGRQEAINYELGVKFLGIDERQQEAIENTTGTVLRRMKLG